MLLPDAARSSTDVIEQPRGILDLGVLQLKDEAAREVPKVEF